MQYHYLDRDLHRSGNSIVVISPGCGVFEVDKDLAGITYQRMMDNGIGSDMLSLGLPPLHIAPFFLYNVSKKGRSLRLFCAVFLSYEAALLYTLYLAFNTLRMSIVQLKPVVLIQAKLTTKFHIGCTFRSSNMTKTISRSMVKM